MTPVREFGLTPEIAAAIESVLKEMNWFDRWPELGRAVTELSDSFHRARQTTPWDNERFRAAYLAYFLPLNFARAAAVFKEARDLGVPVTDRIVDAGSGPGTASLAWGEREAQWLNWELNPRAQDLHRRLLVRAGQDESAHRWVSERPELKGRTVIASYALNEFSRWPAELFEAATLILLEPSTQDSGRRLMEFRQELIGAGFSLWAPCTHQNLCPLLTKSKTDWCHDRIFFREPAWWPELSRHLPMRNQTLTFSYLIASRESPRHRSGLARVIGDTLKEKGKFRQAVCRGPEREFLAWLTRHGEPEIIPHGALIELPPEIEIKANELRPAGSLKRRK
jgi:hypothetical protein